MNNITKISDIATTDLADYLGIGDCSLAEENELGNYLNIAKNFICDYTGIASENLDNYPTFVQVVFVLVQDMYDNRTLYVDKTNINRVVAAILGGHRLNYVG